MDSELCRNCKSFYGSTEGLCSQCFKEEKVKKESEEAVSTLVSSANELSEETKQDKDRCGACKRKLGPMSFACRCGVFYCSRHRLPEQHNCTFDHRTHAQRKLSEENPQIIADKFNRLQ
mmetsp:Transcript_7260/g.10727  ORF Transcript_7260/g.10727 Transcript_7260/m.10727 type:complete len:119 (-) Transcript_7260:1118-1474(-)